MLFSAGVLHDPILWQDDWSWLWAEHDTVNCECNVQFISFIPVPEFYLFLFVCATLVRLLPGGQLYESFQRYLAWYFYGPIDS